MCLLFESIKIHNGKPHLLHLHEKRLNQSRKNLLGIKEKIDLKKAILVPERYQKGLVKCRISYDKDLIKTEFIYYKKKTIKSFKMVYSDEIEYSYKWTDRSVFEKIIPKEGDPIEVIIIKKGLVTDASYANLAFFNGAEWHTPNQPLLKGVQREHLLESGKILEREIREKDLKNYKKVRLINAMLDFEENQLEFDMRILENA